MLDRPTKRPTVGRRLEAARRRDKRYRQLARSEVVAMVTCGPAHVDLLLRLRWLSERNTDTRGIELALQAMIDDAYRRSDCQKVCKFRLIQ